MPKYSSPWSVASTIPADSLKLHASVIVVLGLADTVRACVVALSAIPPAELELSAPPPEMCNLLLESNGAGERRERTDRRGCKATRVPPRRCDGS